MVKRTNTEKYCFDDELLSLKESLLKMANAVEEAINMAIESLIKQRVDLAEQVIRDDDIIDNMELDIEEQCLQMIALRQPIAKKLRIIGCGYKTVSDLERAGDQAVNIARASKYLATKDLVKPFIDLPRMARIAQNMLKDGLEAYFTGDVELAKEVWSRDKTVDDLNKQIFRELLTFMMEDPHTISRAIHIIFISTNIERIADHAKNLVERVVYIVNGERIKEDIDNV
ncbi:MAG: phosphate signaling complex protein PhoU [Candidatus Caldatribacteriota bacterium]|nr:phosphate signaling complex protein PhoU [Candidatus Caldatribacteriota bacterium]